MARIKLHALPPIPIKLTSCDLVLLEASSFMHLYTAGFPRLYITFSTWGGNVISWSGEHGRPAVVHWLYVAPSAYATYGTGFVVNWVLSLRCSVELSSAQSALWWHVHTLLEQKNVLVTTSNLSYSYVLAWKHDVTGHVCVSIGCAGGGQRLDHINLGKLEWGDQLEKSLYL